MTSENCASNVRTPWRIKLLAFGLILLFGFGSLASVVVLFAFGEQLGISIPNLLLAIVLNIGFVIGAFGLLKLRPWSLWLTVGLCGVSLVVLLWQMFATLTPETATKANEIATYTVAGFYLGIAFFLTSESSRKLFRQNPGTPPQISEEK